MKRIKVVQVGIGHDHGPSTFHTLLLNPDVFEVVALGVPEDEQRFLWKYEKFLQGVPVMTPEEALAIDGVEAAVVEAEDCRLTKYAMMAAERGLHIQMDKPGSVDHAAYARMVRLMEKNNKVFHLGYIFRYNPSILQLEQDIKNGKLGEITSIEMSMNCFHKPEKRDWLKAYPGGMTYFLGCHLIDVVLRLQGMPLEVIPMNLCTGLDGAKGEDFGFVLFRYPHGITTVKTSAVEVGGYMRRQLVVCGTKGTVEMKPLEYYANKLDHPDWDLPLRTDVSELYLEETEELGWKTPYRKHTSPDFDRYADMLKSFAAMVRGEKKNPLSYDYEIELHRILLESCGVKVSEEA